MILHLSSTSFGDPGPDRYVPFLPPAVSPAIRRWCKELVPDGVPVFVDVDARLGATRGNCFTNVEMKVAVSGGRAVLGWSIWECPGEYLRAEAHSVWESSDGRLLDITPSLRPEEEEVLLLPDPKMVFSGKPIATRQKVLSRGPHVLSWEVNLCVENWMFSMVHGVEHDLRLQERLISYWLPLTRDQVREALELEFALVGGNPDLLAGAHRLIASGLIHLANQVLLGRAVRAEERNPKHLSRRERQERVKQRKNAKRARRRNRRR